MAKILLDTMTEELPLCECGCGERVTKPGNRFRIGHSGGHKLPTPKFVPEENRFMPKTRIDRIKTIEMMGYDPIDLALKSNKKVWRVCQNCGNGSLVPKDGCSDLCHKCAVNTPEHKLESSKRFISLYADPKVRKRMSNSCIKYWSDQANRDAMSEIITNSEAMQTEHERQRDGHDFIWHHIAYDFGDPDALRVRITRKLHGAIHHPKGIGIHQRGYSLID